MYKSNRKKVVEFVDGMLEDHGVLPYAQARVLVQQKIGASPTLLDSYLDDLVKAGRVSFNRAENTYELKSGRN